MRVAARRSILVTLVTFGVATAGALPAAADDRAPSDPMIALSGRADELDQVWTARLDGTVLQRFTHPEFYGEAWTTISGGLVSVTKHSLKSVFGSNVYLYDGRTGDLDTMIKDARYPLVLWDGTGVMFLPDNNGRMNPNDRDPYVRTVWYRDLVTGEEVRIARIHDPELRPVQLAGSPTGNLLAFTEGNDWSVFEWDIVLVKPNGEGKRYLTSDGRSLSPSFSPDGRTVAMQKNGTGGVCTGSLATKRVNGTHPDRFFHYTCEMRLARPVWINDHQVVAQWWEPDLVHGGSVPRGLVVVDTETGDVSVPLVEGFITSFAVSRDHELVAYRRSRGAVGVIDLANDVVTPVPGGRRLPGTYLHIDGAYELST